MIINLEKVKKLRLKHANKKVVFCSGTFDLTHARHVLFFENCKKYGDILVVMVGDDKAIKKNKGNNRPILNQHIRLKTVDSVKPVNYCLLNPLPEIKEDLNRNLESIFRLLAPDVWVVNTDVTDIDNRRKLADNYGIKLVVLREDYTMLYTLLAIKYPERNPKIYGQISA